MLLAESSASHTKGNPRVDPWQKWRKAAMDIAEKVLTLDNPFGGSLTTS
jgi:hypothetical protein